MSEGLYEFLGYKFLQINGLKLVDVYGVFHVKPARLKPSLTIFFFKYVIDGHEINNDLHRWSDLFENLSGSNGRNCRFGTEGYRFFWKKGCQ